MNLNTLLSSNSIILITIAIIAVLFGILLGVLLTRLSLRGKGTKESQIQALEAELASYKHQVSDHFVETAELVNSLTLSYKSVYEHLEKGAFGLVGENALQKRLPTISEEPISFAYLGHKRNLKAETNTDSI